MPGPRTALTLLLLAITFMSCAKKAIGEPCDDDRECEYDCLYASPSPGAERRVCTKSCERKEDCPDAGVCLGGRCAASCSADEDCPPGALCNGELCAAVCRSDDECVNSVCSTPGELCEPK